MKKRKFIILGFLFLMVLVSCKNNISNSNNTKPTGSEISSGSVTSSKQVHHQTIQLLKVKQPHQKVHHQI